MIKTIAHTGDIHIRKSPARHEEYREVFSNLYSSLEEKKPDRIVIVGDLFHDYLEIEGELLILASEFLNNLAKIAPVRITRGNHDIRKRSLRRIDSIEAVVTAINNPNIQYYKETGFYGDDDNVIWAVWKHGDPLNNPWDNADEKFKQHTLIDLFHDPVNDARTPSGIVFKSKIYRNLKEFKGDFSFFGDIHDKQFFGRKAYPGSLISQDFGEGDDKFHGYLLWDINDTVVEEISIHNNYSFKNVNINRYYDFDDLDTEIENPTTKMRIRCVWETLPAARTLDNERKIEEYLKGKYNDNIIGIRHSNKFYQDDKIEISSDVTVNNVIDQQTQENIFREYLEKIGEEEEFIEQLVELDHEIFSRVPKEEVTNIQWSMVKLYGKNFMSYEDIDIDWRNLTGIIQIVGKNMVGKTTILKLIAYILYGTSIEKDVKELHSNKKFINNKLAVDFCEGRIVILVDGVYYGIKRRCEIKWNRDHTTIGSGGVPMVVEYFILNDPDDEMCDENSVENLDEQTKEKTQKLINRIIGTNDNFMRIVLTTADTLNKVLSSDQAVFVDSLLTDSGLDIFSKKMVSFKDFKKKHFKRPRVNCNVETTKADIAEKIEYNNDIEIGLESYRSTINSLNSKLEKGENLKDKILKSYHDVEKSLAEFEIDKIKLELEDFKVRKVILTENETKTKIEIDKIKVEYSEERHEELSQLKDEFKNKEYQLNTQIKDKQIEIQKIKNEYFRVTNEISRLKIDGKKLKEKYSQLKESKICPTCHQLVSDDAIIVINGKIKDKAIEIRDVANTIKNLNNEKEQITEQENGVLKEIEKINKEIEAERLDAENVLQELGTMANVKSEHEKREKLKRNLKEIPTIFKNYDLNIGQLEDKISAYENMKEFIENNKKKDEKLIEVNQKLDLIKNKLTDYQETITTAQNTVDNNRNYIKEKEELMTVFLKQEEYDRLLKVYEKCIHRDGVPTQILNKILIPKINMGLKDLLFSAPFNVWIEEELLMLKMASKNNPNSVINCIHGSGMERTFSAVALKFVLNELNAKSKPKFFLLDEVMGKLVEESIDKFNELLLIFKEQLDKILIIEPKEEIGPDHIISVTTNGSEISEIMIT